MSVRLVFDQEDTSGRMKLREENANVGMTGKDFRMLIEPSALQRYTKLGCVVSNSRPHGDGDGDAIISWNPYACVC